MKYLFILFLLFPAIALQAQADTPRQLSLQECFAMARAHYPMIRQQELIGKSTGYTLDNISKGYLPQLQVSGQASYQSDVTQIPIHVPGIDIPTLSKDQYKVYAELSQQLYDGGNLKQQKELQRNNGLIAQQQLEIALHDIKDRVSQLFFGILMTRAQLNQNESLQSDLKLSIQKAEAGYQNGSMLASNVDILKAELLNTQQRNIELQATAAATKKMLALFIGLPDDTAFVLLAPEPVISTELSLAVVSRPELSLYELQHKNLEAQDRLRSTRNRPRIGLFLQGGYGRPALNMLNNDFSTYYIGGLRLSWSLAGLYTAHGERAVNAINKQTVALQQETFLFNARLSAEQQYGDIRKAEQLLKSDDEIIRLRRGVVKVSAVQLEQGVVTASDYIRELNAANRAAQNKALHEIQLLMAEEQLQLTTLQ